MINSIILIAKSIPFHAYFLFVCLILWIIASFLLSPYKILKDSPRYRLLSSIPNDFICKQTSLFPFFTGEIIDTSSNEVLCSTRVIRQASILSSSFEMFDKKQKESALVGKINIPYITSIVVGFINRKLSFNYGSISYSIKIDKEEDGHFSGSITKGSKQYGFLQGDFNPKEESCLIMTFNTVGSAIASMEIKKENGSFMNKVSILDDEQDNWAFAMISSFILFAQKVHS